MRQLTSHKVNPANDTLTIEVLDGPGAGGACHAYRISGYNGVMNPSTQGFDTQQTFIVFQNGPVNAAGVNGVTHESLLAILIDRLESFQAGDYACNENAMALGGLRDAQDWLASRTRKRIERGVEGTHTV